MRELIQEIMGLQAQWSRHNSLHMDRRGQVVRTEMPALIRTMLAHNREQGALDFEVQGKDGEGNKSRVPWVRIYSRKHSPGPTIGWYCVYLFSAEGNSVFFCISHGSFERPSSKEIQPRSSQELSALMQWGRSVLGDAPEKLGMTTFINLGRGTKTGDQYIRSTLAGFKYELSALPSDEKIAHDTFAALRLLEKLYDAEDLGQTPGAEIPDVAAVQAVIENISSGGRLAGQGYGLTVDERRAVELQAMSVARVHLLQLGFELTDTSRNRPYDFEATKKDERYIIEVKGTTGRLGSILLTHTEVAAHRDWYPRNALIIIHSIKLSDRHASPRAHGGQIYFMLPWNICLGTLEPMAFKYTFPVE